MIAGAAKGRRLFGPETRDTRPLTDRAKEALFSALGDMVTEASVLDLFAGSGSIGIEALSRGAQRAVFVEKARDALTALRQNLATCGFSNVRVVGTDVEEYLGSVRDQFDLVFCDPPWALSQVRVQEIFTEVDRICAPGAQFVIHRRYADPDPVAPPGWRLVTTRRYGDGKICRYEKEPN